MAKTKATAQDFLSKMKLPEQETEATAPIAAAPANVEPRRTAGRTGLKHIGGYFDRDTVEKVAILRARLDLDNSQLIKRAIDELYSREGAARKFGDR
ncbi:hypothetical protein [Mesorhizobium metallidurans]|nr:hypothetical protein [Mesorhizobium metallidurans]